MSGKGPSIGLSHPKILDYLLGQRRIMNTLGHLLF
jgi:hypothetical protein